MYIISDLRRNMPWIIKLLIKYSTKQKELQPDFTASINASYTVDEIKVILK